MKYCICSRES